MMCRRSFKDREGRSSFQTTNTSLSRSCSSAARLSSLNAPRYPSMFRDACKNEVPLPRAAKCLVIGHFLVSRHWYFIACLIQSILRKLVRFKSIRKPIRQRLGFRGSAHETEIEVR
jgi:hypothetical protein